MLRSSLLGAYGVPYGFLDLDRDSHSFEKNANTLGKSKALIQNFVLDCVNFASLGRHTTTFRDGLAQASLR